jgi:phospholipid transport system transporter-binding protein
VNTPLTIEMATPSTGRVTGKIDVDNAASALSSGADLFAAGKSITADLSTLESADSVTLAVLLAWASRARRAGGALSFKGASSRLRSIAHLSDAESLLGFDSGGLTSSGASPGSAKPAD